MQPPDHEPLVRRAVELLGSQVALAQACGVKQQHVWRWLNRCKCLPAERALDIERATGGAVTRYHLRPDVFGPPVSARAQTQRLAS